jgi:hypothetical protein
VSLGRRQPDSPVLNSFVRSSTLQGRSKQAGLFLGQRSGEGFFGRVITLSKFESTIAQMPRALGRLDGRRSHRLSDSPVPLAFEKTSFELSLKSSSNPYRRGGRQRRGYERTESARLSDIWLLAGPNGARKSTYAPKLRADVEEIVGPDEFAYQIARGSPERAALRAGRLAVERRNELLRQRRSFAVETTISGRGHL